MVCNPRDAYSVATKGNGDDGYEVAFKPGFGNLDNGFRGFEYHRPGGTESEGRVDGVDGVSMPRSRPRAGIGAPRPRRITEANH